MNIWVMQLVAYGWCGMMAGIGGLMQVNIAKEVVPNALYGRELEVLAAVVLGIAALVAMGAAPSLWVVTGLLFIAQIGYEGVRTARKIHLVDMADEDKRAVYTALSNTLIGFVLIAGGVLGVIAQAAGLWAALAVSSVLCIAGVIAAFGLDEVQSE